jgi:hypothetical protein
VNGLGWASLWRDRVAGGQFTDPKNERLLWIAIVGLIAVGLFVLVSTAWWWRSTKLESQALAPLEVMSGRRWRRSTYTERQRLLDGVRPDDAYALADVRAEPEPVAFDELEPGTAEWLDGLVFDAHEPVAVAAAAPGDVPASSADESPDEWVRAHVHEAGHLSAAPAPRPGDVTTALTGWKPVDPVIAGLIAAQQANTEPTANEVVPASATSAVSHADQAMPTTGEQSDSDRPNTTIDPLLGDEDR